MKQAQAMQKKMEQAQAELDELEVQGQAGGGALTVVMSAKGQAKSASVDPSLLSPDEKEILEDLIVAAVNDARAKAERLMQEKMQAVTAGLPLPPGLKLF
jgi:nucleoid-associated protein EbfC